MDNIKAFVLREFGKHGARIIMPSEDLILIMDCPIWTERNTKKMKNAFPSAEVEVESSAHSLSGFVVMIRRGKAGAKHGSMMVFAGILALLLYVAVVY